MGQEFPMIRRLQRWKWSVPILGLLFAFLITAIIFSIPNLTEEVSATGSILLSLALVYLYYQQKTILATEYKPDLIVEGIQEVETEDELDDKIILTLALSNIGKGQARNIRTKITADVNSSTIPSQEYTKHLNRYDPELDGWFQKSGVADYLDAGERKQPFTVDFTTELRYGNQRGAFIGTVTSLLDDNNLPEADRLFLKMEICYQDALDREYTEFVFDYVGPFEEGMALSEYFHRGFPRDTYEELDETLDDDWFNTDLGIDGYSSKDYDPIDRADGTALYELQEKIAEQEGRK